MTIKAKLQQAFDMANDKQILQLVHEYAEMNEQFASFIINRILPSVEDDECGDKIDAEIENLFTDSRPHRQKKWRPFQDWNGISSGVCRMVEKVRKIYQDDSELAAYMALHLLQRICEEYEKDEVWNEQEYDGDDFCADKVLQVITDALGDPDIDHDVKCDLIAEVRDISQMEANANYCLVDFEHFERAARQTLMSAEEYIDDIRKRIETTRSKRDKEELVNNLIYYLDSMGREEEVGKTITKHIDIPSVCQMRIEEQIEAKDYMAAIKTIDKGLVICQEGYESYKFKEKWMYEKAKLFRKLHNKQSETETLEECFINGGDRHKYLKELKKLVPEAEWHSFFGSLLDQCTLDLSCDLYDIAAQEGLSDHLLPLMLKDTWLLWSHEERIAKYGPLLSEDDCRKLCEHVCDKLRNEATQLGRDNYSRIRYTMQQLMQCNEIGARYVHSLIQEFRKLYSNRPAMMQELNGLE